MPKRWLFVTYSPDPKRPFLDASARYRCFNRVEDFRRRGIPAAVVSQQRFMRQPPMDFDVYVFHRPWYTQDFEGMAAYLRRRGKRLLADYDAPVFAEPFEGPLQPPFPEIPASAVSPGETFARALRLFEFVIAATPVLAEQIGRAHGDAGVCVVESGPSDSWREMADSLYRYPEEERKEICLGAGTEIRLDGSLMKKILSSVLRTRKELRCVAGSDNPIDFGLPEGRVTPLPGAVGCHELLGRSHTLLLPAIRDPWNESASAVRALEAAYLGCRVLASPLPAFVRHRDAGIRFADSEREWRDQLCDMEGEQQWDEKARSKARDYVLGHATSAVHTRSLIEQCGELSL